MSEYRDIPVEDVSPNPRNPRETFDEDKIAELAASIDEKGLLQPVLARPIGEGYELVHGERRLRAVQQLGSETIQADVRDISDREALEISITENLQREDVSPLEEARSYETLVEEFDLTQAEAAEKLGKSQSHVANQLKLLDLPEYLQDAILHKIISPWMARTLNSVWGEYWLFDFVVDHDLSVNEAREVVSQLENDESCVSLYRDVSMSFFEGLGQDEMAGGSAQNYLIWRDNNDDDYEYDKEVIEGPHEGKRLADVQDPSPPVYSWVHDQVLDGGLIVHEAQKQKADTLRTEFVFPRWLFAWDSSYDDKGDLAAEVVA